MKIPDVYYLENLAQLQVLSDPVRYRMITLLSTPRTCAQVGRALKIDRAKAHYHLKQLERFGLIKLSRTDKSQAITEKYYIVVARLLDFTKLIPEGDLQPNEVTIASYNSIAAFLATMLDVSKDRIIRSVDHRPQTLGFWFDFETDLTEEQFDHLKAKMRQTRDELLVMSKDTEKKENKEDVLPVHTTLYFSPVNSVKNGDEIQENEMEQDVKGVSK